MTGPTMVWAIVLFLLGFAFLIKGGDWFVDGATCIAKRYHVPELLIGATIVSIGTTLPEVMVSATAAIQGSAGTSYGNAIGSVICNTALISAITVAVRPSHVDVKTYLKPVLFFFATAIFYAVIAYTTGFFARWTGIALLCVFVVYMVYSIWTGMRKPSLSAGEAAEEEDEEEGGSDFFGRFLRKVIPESAGLLVEIILLIAGAALIAVGARLLVDNGTFIARELGVPETVIALTFVALGTSLPELVTAVTALIKGHGALSLGNVVGANLFNLVLVSGMAITVSPFSIPAEKTFLSTGLNASLVVDIPVMFAVMLLLTVPALINGGKMRRWQGVTLLCIYAAFCVFQFCF